MAVKKTDINSHFQVQSGVSRNKGILGSQHPSPNVKNLRNFKTRIWLENYYIHVMPKVLVFKGSQTSCTEKKSCMFFAKIWPKKITSRDGCVLLIFAMSESLPSVHGARCLSGRWFVCLTISRGQIVVKTDFQAPLIQLKNEAITTRSPS